jgi:hypothetical protein
MTGNQNANVWRKCDVLLVNPPYPMRRGGGLVPPIGLCYLASVLREKGAKPGILDLAVRFPESSLSNVGNAAGALVDVLRQMSPGLPILIGIGPLVTATLQSTRHLVSTCRRITSSPIVLGGPLCAVPGIGAVNQTFLRADFVVAGDGEGPITRLWRSLRDGSPVKLGDATEGNNGHDPTPRASAY